jgi:hypothetical protein
MFNAAVQDRLPGMKDEAGFMPESFMRNFVTMQQE